MSDVPCRSVAPLSPTKIASNWSPQASILTAAKCLYSNSIQNPLSDSLSNTDPIINLPEPRNKTQVNILHNGHALRRARSFYDKLIDMAWAWGWAQVWIVYKHCACTLVRSYARTLQNIKWWGLGKMLEHRCGLCTTIAPVRSYAHAHIIPPDTRSEEGATPTHRHYGPAPVLTATPGLAQISGDPAWLTQGTLPPPPPPYLTLPRHWRQSSVQNTAGFFGIKTKL